VGRGSRFLLARTPTYFPPDAKTDDDVQYGNDVEYSSTRSGFAMEFQKSQPIESVPTSPPPLPRPPSPPPPRREPNGPAGKHGCIISHTKSAYPRNERKSWQHFEHLRTIACTDIYEENVLHKSEVGTYRPRVPRRTIRTRIIMTVANCITALA
jgi:hypothetical protein